MAPSANAMIATWLITAIDPRGIRLWRLILRCVIIVVEAFANADFTQFKMVILPIIQKNVRAAIPPVCPSEQHLLPYHFLVQPWSYEFAHMQNATASANHLFSLQIRLSKLSIANLLCSKTTVLFGLEWIDVSKNLIYYLYCFLTVANPWRKTGPDFWTKECYDSKNFAVSNFEWSNVTWKFQLKLLSLSTWLTQRVLQPINPCQSVVPDTYLLCVLRNFDECGNDYAVVGGNWKCWRNRTNSLLCLICLHLLFHCGDFFDHGET